MAENKTAVDRSEFEAFKAEISEATAAILSRLESIGQVDQGRVRYSREQEMQAQDVVHEQWDDGSDEQTLLGNPALKARPGFAQMWVRTAAGGEADGANVARMFNQGWSPRLSETLPKELQGSCTTDFEGRSVIGWRGTVLCEMPIEMHRRILEQRERKASMLMRNVDQTLRGQHDPSRAGMGAPRFLERQRTVETGRPAPMELDL